MKRTAAILAALVLAICSSAQQKVVSPKTHGMDPEHLALVDEVIGQSISDGTIPGAVLAVVSGNDLVYLKAYGNKSVTPEVVPMTTETIFDLASCSKVMGTTLSFMQLVEDGKVRLIDNVNRYIPDFQPWTDPETGETVHITIRDLLTHSSGLAPYINVNSFVSEFGENAPDDLEKYIATRVKRNFRPGTDFMYSCLNFITLQRILERVTGRKLYEYAHENVFAPLGLRHTCYFPLDASLPPLKDVDYAALSGLCAPTEVQADGLPLVARVHDPIARRIMGGNSGNAGLFSNARDLAVMCSAIMQGGLYFGGKKSGWTKEARILSPLTIKMMTTIPEENDHKVGRALGWDKKSDYNSNLGDIFDKDTTIGHTGYTGTSVVIDMKTRTAVILLAHRVHPKDEGSVSQLRSKVANIVAASILYPVM